MQKLDKVLQKLDENGKTLSRDRIQSTSNTSLSPQRKTDAQYLTPNATARPVDQAIQRPINTIAPNSDRNTNELITPGFRTAPDTILEWPVLKSRTNNESGFISDALFEESFIDSNPYLRPPIQHGHSRDLFKAVVEEERFPRLVDLYLTHVHIKNPIIDARIAKANALRMSEEGCRWDGSSCLVVWIGGLSFTFADAEI